MSASPSRLSTRRDGLVAGERLEQDRRRVQLAAAPARPDLEQLRPRDAEQQEQPASRVQSARCSIRSRKVGSAQWMSSNTTTRGRSRARCSSSLRTAQNASSVAPRLAPAEQPADEPSDPLARRRHSARSAASFARAVGSVVGPSRSAAACDDLGEREERDALAVGEAAAAEDRRVGPGPAEELLHEPRLADARRPEQREQVRGALGPSRARARAGASRAPSSRPTIGESRCRAWPPCRPSTRRAGRRRTGSDLPFSSSGSTGSTSTASLHERDTSARPAAPRPAAAACSSRAATFTASPVTSRWSVRRVAGHDLAGVHADPRGDADAVVALELVVQRGRARRACPRRRGRRAARRPRGAAGCRTRPSRRRR